MWRWLDGQHARPREAGGACLLALAQTFSPFFSKFAVGPRKVEISKKFAGRDRKSAFHSRLKRHGAFLLP